MELSQCTGSNLKLLISSLYYFNSQLVNYLSKHHLSLNTKVSFILTKDTQVSFYFYLFQIQKARAESEVILSGGAINSPHLLMLSGIGNVDYLRSIGIDAWHHLPGVGQNLQDHLELYVQQACKKVFNNIIIKLFIQIAYINENRFTIITISFDAHNSMKTQVFMCVHNSRNPVTDINIKAYVAVVKLLLAIYEGQW